MQAYPKRLIEVDLPIARISAHARREKSLRHGHLSTLHIWWARRPLASCRAMSCAALWPAPTDSSTPSEFIGVAREQMLAWATEHLTHLSRESYQRFIRYRTNPALLESVEELEGALFDFIADFSDWDNANAAPYLAVAETLTLSAHRSLTGDETGRPLVFDPFCGGGSIPLEANRIGADSFASDLNPIAVSLNRVLLTYFPRYRGSLVDKVREKSVEVGRLAKLQLQKYYASDSEGTSVAYLWARTIRCEGPGCGARVPLIRSMQVTKEGEKWHYEWNIQGTYIGVALRRGSNAVSKASVAGGSVSCPIATCGYTTKAKAVRLQLQQQRGGAEDAQLLSVYVQEAAGRQFRAPTDTDIASVALAVADRASANAPTDEINDIRPYKNTRGLSAVTRIGICNFGDMYTSRQALAIRAFQRALLECDFSDMEAGLAQAVRATLNCAVSRFIFQNSSLSRWNASRATIEGAFGKQALQVVWDFAESNPLSSGPANWTGSVDWVVKVLEQNRWMTRSSEVVQSRAQDQVLPDGAASALLTDPPYFAAIPYADLSNVFYVWERDTFKSIHPGLFSDGLVNQVDEIIVTNANKGPDGVTKDAAYYKAEMMKALASGMKATRHDGIAVIVFADSRTESWEAILGAVVDSGWRITGSWPIDTERQTRTQAAGAASLQSSVHIVCRPRLPDASNVGDWRDVSAELAPRISEWMRRLSAEGVVGADAIFACLGPALEIYSRYERVEKASGEVVPLPDFLGIVWATVSREALNTVFINADAASLEQDARLTAMWLWTLTKASVKEDEADDEQESITDDEEVEAPSQPKKGGFKMEFDAARKISQGLGIHLEDLGNLVEVAGDTARLLGVGERARYLLGKEAAESPNQGRKRAPQLGLFADEIPEEPLAGSRLMLDAGKTALDRVHQAMLLFAAGRSEAMRVFVNSPSIGGNQQFWVLAQALSALYPASSDEKRWVDGLLARKKGLGF
jgi:putative DNA methylase